MSSPRKRIASEEPASTSQPVKKRRVAVKDNRQRNRKGNAAHSAIRSAHSPTPTLTEDEVESQVIPKDEILNSSQSSPDTIQDQLTRLNKELALKNDLLERHQATFSAMQTALQCQICMEVLRDPYMQAFSSFATCPYSSISHFSTSCGHTACVGCLQEWFRAPPPGAGDADPPLVPHLRPKSCPTCRAPLRNRPIRFFLANSMITIVSPHFDLDAAEHFAQRGVRIVPGGQPPDPWAGLFPPDDLHHHRPARGLIVDHDDGGILRCEFCLHEVVDGICQGCGRMFGDENGDLVQDGDGEGSVGDGDHHPGAHWDAPILDGWAASEDEDEGEDDEPSDDDSFIDDEGAFDVHIPDGGVLARYARYLAGHHHHHHHHHPQLVDNQNDREAEEDHEPAHHIGPLMQPGLVLILSSDSSSDANSGSESESEGSTQDERERERELYGDDDFVNGPRVRPNQRRRNRAVVVSSDDDEGSESDAPIRRRPNRIVRRLATYSEDDQDSNHSGDNSSNGDHNEWNGVEYVGEDDPHASDD
ncbi:hypothetical protein FRC02_010378 [Tulasnella sp. 418]|nr:hypothetical protein FRC02_010378 [Tulasnella sp. 418]